VSTTERLEIKGAPEITRRAIKQLEALWNDRAKMQKSKRVNRLKDLGMIDGIHTSEA
jgi:hypothetical protein